MMVNTIKLQTITNPSKHIYHARPNRSSTTETHQFLNTTKEENKLLTTRWSCHVNAFLRYVRTAEVKQIP